jgi:feruloyl esterase
MVVMVALAVAGCTLGTGAPPEVQRLLVEVPDFAPGHSANLRMYKYVPESAGPNAPLVVVLHHCFQSAADYLEDSGWHTVANRYGLVLLLPQQSVLNDFTYCFSWSHETTQTRGNGESQAIALMVERMIRDERVDRSRIFVTGLSSGGSMTLVMLATHPELFAGGAVIGAVPFGCATSGIEFPGCLLGSDAPALASPAALGDRIRAVNPSYRGPWPRLMVWHGTEDRVSRPVNGELILQQWLNLHGIASGARESARLGAFPRSIYRDHSGQDAVDFITLTGIGHSTPVDSAHGCGSSNDGVGNFISDIGLCSSEVIAQFWGLRPAAAAQAPRP